MNTVSGLPNPLLCIFVLHLSFLRAAGVGCDQWMDVFILQLHRSDGTHIFMHSAWGARGSRVSIGIVSGCVIVVWSWSPRMREAFTLCLCSSFTALEECLDFLCWEHYISICLTDKTSKEKLLVCVHFLVGELFCSPSFSRLWIHL